MKKTLSIALAAGCILANAAQWNFKDGDHAKIIRENKNPALNGKINNPALCTWAREDDRGWFLTFKNGGSVIIPHADFLNLAGGFTAKIHFSCDLSRIGKQNFSNLFTKGGNFQQGYSVMVGRGGTLMLNLKGFKPEYRIIKTGFLSNVEYKLAIYAGKGKVRIFVNGKEKGSYSVTGSLSMKSNRKPLYIGAIGGYGFTGNLYSLFIGPYTSPPEGSGTKNSALKSFHRGPIIDPPGTVIVNQFDKFEPRGTVQPAAGVAYTGEQKWVYRKVGFMEQSPNVLHPAISPDSGISFDPKLKGTYDVYAGVRAVSNATAIQLNFTGSKIWYRIETLPVGTHHRNAQLLVARNIRMNGVKIRLASCSAASYLGYIKFAPAGTRKQWKPDPIGKVTPGPKFTSDALRKLQEAEIRKKIQSGYFRELHHVDPRKLPVITTESERRGYLLFEQPWMKLLFKNSIPERDSAKLAPDVKLAPGEFEPLTIGIHALRDLKGLTLRQTRPFPHGIRARIAVVEAIPKRTSNYCGPSEFIVAPQYLENRDTINVKKGESRQFWITLQAPENIAPGKYTGEFELSGTGRIEKIPVTAEIRPFKLLPADGYDIGFWVGFGGQNPAEIDAIVKQLSDHGMTSMGIGHFFVLTGKNENDYSIDFKRSLVTPVMNACRKYGIRGHIHMGIDQLCRGSALPRLVRQLDSYGKKNHWPAMLYTTYDEVPSHPKQFPAFIASIKAIHQAGFPVIADHIWYKTSRPLQKEVDLATPYIDVFIERFNTRRLFYVDSWEEMEAEALKRGKKLYAYNSNNALTFAQPASMRFAGGWFFRSFGKHTTGHIFWAYNFTQTQPYTDLDGDSSDWMYFYPPFGTRKGGPAIDLEAFREGVDDLRYILTLEDRIRQARKKGFTKQADDAQQVFNKLTGHFDKKSFYTKSVFFDSKWSSRRERPGKGIEVGGELNLPNGWALDDYPKAREIIAGQIIRLENLMKGEKK